MGMAVEASTCGSRSRWRTPMRVALNQGWMSAWPSKKVTASPVA